MRDWLGCSVFRGQQIHRGVCVGRRGEENDSEGVSVEGDELRREGGFYVCRKVIGLNFVIKQIIE